MKYYYQKPKTWENHGIIFQCDHPMFNRCTLFLDGDRGLCVIQEHYNSQIKARWWGKVEAWIASDIYLNKNFNEFFEQNAKEINKNELYPVFKLREIMWKLRMKPLKKEYWEEF